mmetsp:Transcript_139191/g.242249  ORF Transcript_139191/g.242249 Transcript_139191/m.242249 type:complete len:690 (-) Transcript_139191:41-2110(-)
MAKVGILDPTTEKEGFGQCLYHVDAFKSKRGFRTELENGSKTLVDVLQNSVKAFAPRKCAGNRGLKKQHFEEGAGGRKFEKLELENEFSWITYQEYENKVRGLAGGLQAFGLQPRDKLVIYAETQVDWMVSAFAAWYNNATVVTIYATLGEEGALHGINQTKASVVVADSKLLKILMKILPKCNSVKTVVTIATPEEEVGVKLANAGVTLKTISDLVEHGEREGSNVPVSVTPEDIAVIMYTSGTTGAPKGVMISHSNIISTVDHTQHFLNSLPIKADDVFLAYLPLAHIFELCIECVILSVGASLGYGNPHTLTDSGVKLKRPESMGDAPCLQPTIMIFAPAVLDKVYQSIQAKRNNASGFKQTLFTWGINSGERHFNRGQVGANKLWNKLVFSQVQGLVGGKLRGMVTGSAPLSPDIQKFIQTCFNAPVRQGYGLTETCAASCVTGFHDNGLGIVGPPLMNTVIRLADWAEGNYRNSDLQNPSIKMRRGEVLIGGPQVTVGYYMDPENPDPELQKKNEEDWVVIDGIRFFRTGDIGQITEEGSLMIIDRKKDLWKGPNGEYVALTKVEAVLKLSEWCEMPMVYGKTGGEYPVALICPFKKTIEALGAEKGISGDFDALCQDPAIVETVSKALIALCKEQKLVDFEIPKKYALISELWTPENDLLTAAMKLKRPIIAEKHKADIAKMY